MARASEGNEQLLCSFCGKSQRQVKKLIAGPGVYICDECIDLCNEIIDEELTTPTQLDLDNLPRPRDIYAVLNDYVVSQEEAKRSVARELVLEAAAEKLGIDIPDSDVEALVREQAEAFEEDADDQLLRLRESGRFEALREDLRLRKALDAVASQVKRIPRELAAAREALWTPDKEKPDTEAKLWTPGS